MNAARRCQSAPNIITRKLAVEATLRLVERAEACTNAGDRRSLVNAAARILRECNMTPADLPRGRAA